MEVEERPQVRGFECTLAQSLSKGNLGQICECYTLPVSSVNGSNSNVIQQMS